MERPECSHTWILRRAQNDICLGIIFCVETPTPPAPMNLASSYSKLDRLLASIGGFLQSPLLLVIRFYWGLSFCQTGWGKLTDIANKTRFFESLHIPFPK